MAANDAYREVCARYADEIPLFHQPWWLDVVAGEAGWMGLTSDALYADRPVIMPLVSSKKWGLSTIRKPLLTTYSGPVWIGTERLSQTEKGKMIHQLWPSLLAKIPQVAYLDLRCRPEEKYVYPFIEIGMKANVRYTYTIDLKQSETQLFANFSKTIRQKVRKHRAHYQCFESQDVHLFFPLINEVYQRQQRPVPFTFSSLSRLFKVANRQQATKLLLAKRDNGTIDAGLLLFFDADKVYLAISAASEDGRLNAAIPVLLWYALRRLHSAYTTFDFCGSMMPNIAARNRAYGALPETYFSMQHARGLAKLKALW